MGRCCAVHGCLSGRKASEKIGKVNLFKTPKNVEMRSKWNSALGQELKATSFICELHFSSEYLIKSDLVIFKDSSVCEYQKVRLKKKAKPKSIVPANTNFSDGADTVIDNDNLLNINETEEFSFYSIEKLLESQPLPKNWSWTVIKNSFISLSYISSKLELVSHVKFDMIDSKVTVINAKTNIVVDMDVNISSIACVWQLLNTLENTFFCSGTGYVNEKCSVSCTGILLPEERYEREVLEYRCIACRKLRHLIKKRKTETINNKAQWMKFKHRFIGHSRKLNRVVHMNKILKQQLLNLKSQCAEIKEVLSEKIADLQILQQETDINYLLAAKVKSAKQSRL